jgi:Rho family protein
MANKVGAKKYMECSSLTGDGVDDIFEAATRLALLHRDDSEAEAKGCCNLM